jgi:hypothetical protein
MNRKQFWLLAVLCMATSLLGGGLVTLMFQGTPAWAKQNVMNVVSARKFQLVGQDGVIRGLWHIDSEKDIRLQLSDGEGYPRMFLTVTENGHSDISVFSEDLNGCATMTLTEDGDGIVLVRNKDGKIVIGLATDTGNNGGMVSVYNKTGEEVAQLRVDDYGNGVVGAFNRKGTGRTLQPGP